MKKFFKTNLKVNKLKIIFLFFAIFFYFSNQAFSKEICSWITNEAYPEELQEHPNAYFYAVVGDNGRCEYGRGPDQETAFNNCEKWKKENSISGACQPFAIGKEIIWEGSVSVVSNNSGCIEGNCQNGKGTMVAENGDTYKGEWQNGKMHGQGTLVWANGDTYEGEWKNDKTHGQGTMVWVNGEKYEGEWENGIMHGQGTLTFFENGDEYKGEWINGEQRIGCIEGNCWNGKGTMVWENGDTYEGEWKNNKTHGQGKMVWVSGDTYEGEWKNGEMYREGIGCIEGNCENGYGTVVWDDGDKYIGNFKDGALHGEGELTFAEDGEIWVGTWKNDKLQGRGETVAWDGSTRVCEFDGYKCAKLIKQIKNFIFKGGSSWIDKDIITKNDVSTFKTLKFVEEKEVMEYDKRTSKNKNQYGDGIEMKVFNAFIFNASFEKSQDILIKVNAEFKTQEKAEKQALKWAKMYGQMPYFLKQNVKYIVVHKGNVGWAGGNGQIVIHIHSEKSSFNEELMFHELTHASLDFKWSTGVIDEDEWKTVIGEDKYYISEYAWDLFYEEDLAETALWWFATRCKPSSISKKNYDKIIKHLPNRLNYLDKQNFDFYPVKCE